MRDLSRDIEGVFRCLDTQTPREKRPNMSTVSSFEGNVRKPKGEVLYTGPDGIGDHRVRVEDQFFIGHSAMSPEATNNLQYLCRAHPGMPHPPPKSAHVGEIGWGVPKEVDYSLLKSDHQIKLKMFRQALEDKYTHRYQEPYYPPPQRTIKPKETPADTKPPVAGTTSTESLTSSDVVQACNGQTN